MAAAIAAAACTCSAPAWAAAVCGEGIYSYAGFDGPSAVSGVSATIAQAGPLEVRAGHVAGWIGVVEPNTGDAWLQVGLSALPGDTTSSIFYEVAFAGKKPVYHELRRSIRPGDPHRFAVLEMQRRPGWWRVWLDGKPITVPLFLEGSQDRWTAQVLGESWAGTVKGSCNSYSYAFTGVSLFAAAGHRLAGLPRAAHVDPNNMVVRRSRSSSSPPFTPDRGRAVLAAASTGLRATSVRDFLRKASVMRSFCSFARLPLLFCADVAMVMVRPLKHMNTSFSTGVKAASAGDDRGAGRLEQRQ